MRTVATILMLMFIMLIVFTIRFFAEMIKIPVRISFWGSSIIGFVLILMFIYFAVRNIPAEPPHKGVLVFLGRRLNKVLYEGWHFLPLYPIVFDIVMVKVVKINQDLPEQIVKTPDFADLRFNISITWTPGSWIASNEEQANLLIAFLNSGGEEGVKNILKDIIQDRLRIWAFSGEEGPADWEEAVGAKDEALAILIKAILGDDIPTIPSSIPTNVLLRYFSTPKKKPLAYQKRWGKQSKAGSEWEGLENELGELSSEEYSELEKAVKERQGIITKVKQGNGVFVKRSLGFTTNRFTINEVALRGRVAEAVESRVVEKHQREAERTETRHVRQRAKELCKEELFSPEQAVEIVQTERGKITKSVDEKKITVSTETRGLLEKLIQVISK